MDGFEDVKLTWQGEEYVVPADRVFDLVRRVEKTVMDGGSEPAFVLLMQNKVPQSTLATAYAEALVFAGAEVAPSEVYLSVMTSFAENAAEGALAVQNAVIGLLAVISPPLAQEILAELPAGK